MTGWKKLSRAEPGANKKSTVLASELFRATLDFLHSELQGAFETEIFVDSDGYITASPDWLAQYIKLLFNTVYGEGVVHIGFEIKGKSVEIKATWQSRDELDGRQISELERAADRAGFAFDIKYSDGFATARIKAESSELMTLQVYALSYSEIYEAFKRAFFL